MNSENNYRSLLQPGGEVLYHVIDRQKFKSIVSLYVDRVHNYELPLLRLEKQKQKDNHQSAKSKLETN